MKDFACLVKEIDVYSGRNGEHIEKWFFRVGKEGVNDDRIYIII